MAVRLRCWLRCHEWPRQLQLSRATRRITVGVPDRVKGLYRAATAPSQPISLQDKVEHCLLRLEQISSERADPLKPRYQRLLKEVYQARGALSSPQLLRVLAMLSQHPLVLYSDAARPLLETATQRLAVAKLENPSASQLAGACLSLAFIAASKPALEREPQKAALRLLLPRALEAQLSPSTSPAGFLTQPLLAAALLPLEVDVSAAASVVLNEESFWRIGRAGGPGGAQSKQLAHAVAALGMLKDQGAVLPSNTVQRVQRLLDLDRVAAELPELVLMFQGLRGLSLDETRLGLGLRDLQRARLALRGAGAVPVLELCEVLQLLLTCGRLTPEEPFVFDYFRLAANNVDRLLRGERRLLKSSLEHLATQLGLEPGVSWTDLAQAPAFPASSQEAAVCQLARFDWFSRKSRAQIPWSKHRGRLR
ncbi:unnamed protein product [Effrenium voratum]|uniref:Uncharacterized protein n=1 Tax=Effrenium voratum TaxID=2562239 RepID=A0AA36MNY7_9DINO|nr:unnamed protein product [Effrenium voratum]